MFKKKIKLLSIYLSIITGNKKILVLPGGIRWGNTLYFLLYAFKNNLKLIARNDDHLYWLKVFPQFAPYFIDEKDIKKLDYKVEYSTFFQSLNKDFSYSDLNDFVSEYFIHEVRKFKPEKKYSEDALYINVRRGDYYGTPHEKIYGFDVTGFIKHCFETQQIENQQDIVVISDDIPWCKENLQFLQDYTDNLNFADNLDARASFFELATAKKLLISNSTFCYWAAYINTLLYGEDSEIYAPDFINRVPQYSECPQYLTQWKVISGFNFNNKYK